MTKSGKPGTVADSTMLDDRPASSPASTRADLPTISRERYDIAGEHARGGLGVILRAHDQQLERTVAIKEIGANADERSSTRFVREALITARLQHPGIVPVYEAGRWPNGARFYAMKMVSGRTLRDELSARDELEDRLALVPNVLAVAEAVGYAHAEGVIHRDLKPANIMIGAFGETVVVDWGLAKDRKLGGDAPQAGLYAQTHAEATHVGTVIGTPAYMSPEQARGEDVDERADVWAIGAILYHLLAAEPPFRGAPESVIERVATEPVPPLGGQAKRAPRDLIAIVTKAMAREPSARYANAKELAGDLSRFLTGQLVGAREYTRLAKIEHWVKQHRAPVIVGAILLAILAVTATFSIAKIVDKGRIAEARSDELLLTQASSQLERDPTAALAWIKQYPADGADPEAARNIAADAFSRGVAKHVWRGHREEVDALAVSRDGSTVATASGKTLQLFDRVSGARLARADIPSTFHLQFSPDGRTIVGLTDDGIAFSIDRATATRRELGRAPGSTLRILFAPDNASFVTCTDAGGIWRWHLDGTPPSQLASFGTPVLDVAVADDSMMALVHASHAVTIWGTARDGAGASELVTIRSPEMINGASFTPDGSTMFIAMGTAVARWKFGDVEPTEIARLRSPITKLAVARDGHVAAGAADGSIVLVAPDKPPRMLVDHHHAITALAFDEAASSSLISGDDAGEVRVWNELGVDPLIGHAGKIADVALVPGGAITTSHDRSARAWVIHPQGATIPISRFDLFRVAWLPERLVASGRDMFIHSVDVASGTTTGLTSFQSSSYDFVVTKDHIVASGWDGGIELLNRRGEELAHVETGAMIWRIAVSPDGKRVAAAAANGDITLWTLSDSTTTVVDHHVEQARDVLFVDDHTLVTSGEDAELHVVDLETKQKRVLSVADGAGNMASLVLSADHRTLYTGGDQGEVRAWDLATGNTRLFTGHNGRARTVTLSSDERYLASGDVNGGLIVWDLAHGGARRDLIGHTAEARHVAFAPGRNLLASAGWDGTVRLWNLDDGEVTVWRGHQGKVHWVAFSPDGTRLASVGEDGTVRVWSLFDQVTIHDGRDALLDWANRNTTAVIDHKLVVTPP